MSATSDLFDPKTSEGTSSATSSPASEDGATPSTWPDGRKSDQSGQPASHASPTPSLASLLAARKAKEMTAIFGRASSASSESLALMTSMASRLQAALSGAGGTVQRWILSLADTPLRRPYCELTPSGRTTREKGSSGVPTPAARDGKDLSSGTAYLAARKRHSPSLATLLLERGVPWQAIPAAYGSAMGYPSVWEEAASTATATQLSRRSPQLSSEPQWCEVRQHYCRCDPRCDDGSSSD